MTSEIRIRHDLLAAFSQSLFEGAGVSREKALLLADSLVAGSLRGVDSHGVQLIPRYIERMECGDIDIQAQGRVVSESGCVLVYDGEHGIGQVISAICCDHAIRLARPSGIGMVVARESSHFGAAAYWAQRFSSAGLIGIVMCNASSSIAPWQGREPRVGTNPICMSVPSRGGGAWLLDMATTTVAWGKIYKAVYAGEKTIPAGWAMDRNGVPTTDTMVALGGLVMPLGGYKGSGLAAMVEILCGVLGGGGMVTDLGGIATVGRRLRTSQMFLAIEVSRFLPLEVFEQRITRLVQELKSSKPAAGYDEVLVAGDPEWRAEAERLQHGVPVEYGVWKHLVSLAERFNVPLPEAMESPG
jgi:LDH2 family malate/lactate/ureidoglycolate dehydrogenase